MGYPKITGPNKTVKIKYILNAVRFKYNYVGLHITISCFMVLNTAFDNISVISRPGADPGIQVRGGALKKIAPSGGRRENFWDISCEKSRFYAKKSYFFQF